MRKIIHTLSAQSIKVKLLGLFLFLAGNLQACSDEETASIQVNTDVLYFGGLEEAQELQIQSSGEWKVTVAKGGEWCHYHKKESAPSVLFVSVDANPTEKERLTRLVLSSGSAEKRVEIHQKAGSSSTLPTYPQIDSDLPLSSLTDEQGNILPDFSNIGYMGSEQEIPDVKVVETIEAPANGADATRLIQDVIDKVSQNSPTINGFKGAILLKKGRYHIAGTLSIKSAGIILRGEGENPQTGTVLIAAGKGQRSLIKFEGTGSSSPNSPTIFNIKDDYVPVGQFWVRVLNPASFQVGDEVTIYRPGTAQWISDLKMDQIPERTTGDPIVQWAPESYHLSYERTITHIIDDALHFDNPIMMAMETQYNKGAVFKSSFKGRINRCGVENILIESEYASETDEDHGWYAIEFSKVEQSWVRNITSRYFGNGLVNLNSGTRFVTVKDCKCLDAKSIITGGRRYSYNMNQAQQCLVINCEATEGRHDCVTGSKGVGPNAFVRVKIRNAHGDTGPHQRWNVGTLYDNIDSDNQINVQDRSNWGTGHGWAGANQVLWNCTAKEVCVQNPWVSAKNYSIGTKGNKSAGDFKNPVRPDGVWVKANTTVSPASLFEAQLELRKRTGRLYHN